MLLDTIRAQQGCPMGNDLLTISEHHSAVQVTLGSAPPALVRQHGCLAEIAWHDLFSGLIPSYNTGAT